jgi:hypothetical protein
VHRDRGIDRLPARAALPGHRRVPSVIPAVGALWLTAAFRAHSCVEGCVDHPFLRSDSRIWPHRARGTRSS